ncbi:hypothetical protein P9112_014304 [Eukaryota sp. TZLM1-RC]
MKLFWVSISCFLLLISIVSCKTLLLTSDIGDVTYIKDNLGHFDNHIDTYHFSEVDLSPYTDVVVVYTYYDLNSDDAKCLIEFVSSGNRLVLFGFSQSESFIGTISELISITRQSWNRPPGDAELSIWDHGCALTTGLNDTTILENDAYLFGVVEDPFARVCFRDRDGIPSVVTKAYGKGVLTYFPLGYHERLFESSTTTVFLRQLLSNALSILPHQARWKRPDALMVYDVEISDAQQTRYFESMVSRFYTKGYLSYDVIYTYDYEKLPFSEYKHVNLYINGHKFSQEKFESLYNAVEKGMKLSIFGTSTTLSHALDDSGLLRTNTEETSWLEMRECFIYDLPNHPLLANVIKDFSFIDYDYPRFAVRVTDPKATVVLRNSNGWPALLAKQVGNGFLTFATPALSEFAPTGKDTVFMTSLVKNCFALTYKEAEFRAHEILVIQTTQSSANPSPLLSSEWFLREEGIKYNVVATNEYYGIDCSLYTTVIVMFYKGEFSNDNMEVVESWLEAGKRVIFFGGSYSESYISNINTNFIKLRTLRDNWISRSADIDAAIVDPSDPLTSNLPKEYSFQGTCTFSYVDIADPNARVSIRRENGFGFPLAVTKVVQNGVFVLVDFYPDCYRDDDSSYFKQLLLNAIHIEHKDTQWTRKKVLLSISTSIAEDSPLEMNGLLHVLNNIGIEYDFIMPNSFSSSDLESYSTFFIAYNGGKLEEDEVADIIYLLKQNKKIYFWGGTRSYRFTSHFKELFHVKSQFEWFSTGIPHLESFETGRFNTKLPTNITFTESFQYMLRPTGREGVIYQRNGDGYGTVACKSTEEWGNSIFALTSFVPKFGLDSDIFSYVRQIIINFFQLQPSDCTKRSRRHAIQISHSRSMLPSEFGPALNSAQHALGGRPFNQRDSPKFDLYLGDEELFDPGEYDSVFLMLNEQDFESSLYTKLNASLYNARTKLFFCGGSSDSDFSTNFDKYLIRHSYNGEWTTSTEPMYTLTTTHPLTQGLPLSHRGETGSREYVIKVTDADVNVLAYNGDKVPFLVEKRVGRSSSVAYITTPFNVWGHGDHFVQHMLIHNFYQYL